MSTFPSIISTISNPASTDKLNAPSHSSIESAQNDAILKLETFIGTQASALGTLMYDIRAAASDGGGHVQGTNKGGTGQTQYTKGDILAASSSSVLSKLAVGSNNQALVADSNQASGVKWAGVATAEAIQNQQYVYARASVMSASVYGVVLGQAVSILSDGLGLVVKFPTANASSIVALQVNATGPSSLTALVKTPALSNLAVGNIQPSMIGVLEFDSVSSVFQMVTPPKSIVKCGSTTKDVSEADATQTIAHGLGMTPKFVRISCMISGVIGVGQAFVVYDGTTQSAVNIRGDVGSVTHDNLFRLNRPDDNESAYNTGTITFDATNIYIAWVKTGGPSGTFGITWEAYS